MKEKLIIFLHNHNLTHPSWVLVDINSASVHFTSEGDPSFLAELAIKKEVIILVPAEDVLLTSVSLPKMSKARLQQVLPYALEEQLTADVESLHFAQLTHEWHEQLPVALVAREKMQEWLSLLQSWQIEADVLSPLSLALPLEENSWHVALFNLSVVRTGIYAGFVSDQANLSVLLSIALTESHHFPEWVQVDHIIPQQTESSLVEKKLLTLSIPSKENIKPCNEIFNEMAEQIVKFPSINLLQGRYKVKKRTVMNQDKIWRILGYSAMTWVALLFLYPTISYFILSQHAHGLESQIAEIYHYHFPRASSVVAPKLRLAEKLKQVSAQSSENKLLSLMADVSEAMSQISNLQLKRLDFQANQLILDLIAGSPDDIAQFSDYLRQQNLQVKQQNANLLGTRISATVIIG